MKLSGRKILLPLFIFFIAGILSCPLYGTDYYLLPEVIATTERPYIGSFLTRLSEDDTTNAGGELMTPFPFSIDQPAIIFSSTFREVLSDKNMKDFVLVGEYTIFIPKDFRENYRESVKQWIFLFKKVAKMIDQTDGWVELKLDFRKEIGADIKPVDVIKSKDTDRYQLVNEDGDTVSIFFDVVPFIPVYSAKNAIQNGTVVHRDQFTRTYVRDPGKHNYLTSLPENNAYAASRYVSAGSIIKNDDIEKEKLIRSGERVTIIVDRYPISMKLEGIAFGTGGKGDEIRVKPIRSEKSLYATVRSKREVCVEDL